MARTRGLLSLFVVLPPLLLACETEDSVPVVTGYLEGAEGARLYYRTTGTGPVPIVLVHGGPGAGMSSFPPAIEPLAEDFLLIFYDQRGGGRSALPEDPSKLQARYFVEDLEAVREHFELDRMNVIAHSFGAVLVARYAQKYPHRIERMVFHAATGPKRSQAAQILRAKAEAQASRPTPDAALSRRASELLQALLEGTASDPVATCREYEESSRKLALARGQAANYQGTTCQAPPEAIAYYYRHTARLTPESFGDWDFTTGLEEVTAPLLVVYGEDDSLGLPAQQSWAEAVPNGRLLLVPGAGKGPLSDNPDVVLGAIARFFRGGD